MANLSLAFGNELSLNEKRRITRKVFKNLALIAVEFARLPRIVPRLSEHVKLENGSAIIRGLQQGKGVIFLASHFGNWELMGHACMKLLRDHGYLSHGSGLAAVARPLNNPHLDCEVRRLRSLNGATVLKKKWVTREILVKLKNNWCVAILFDQHAGREAPLVPFFGHPAFTTPAPALLALKTGAAVIPVFCVRTGYGRFRIHVTEPVEIISTGDRERDIMENCGRFNRVLEEWVRRYPEQWLWLHRRWRAPTGIEKTNTS